jgi:hypothetical protein
MLSIPCPPSIFPKKDQVIMTGENGRDFGKLIPTATTFYQPGWDSGLVLRIEFGAGISNPKAKLSSAASLVVPTSTAKGPLHYDFAQAKFMNIGAQQQLFHPLMIIYHARAQLT